PRPQVDGSDSPTMIVEPLRAIIAPAAGKYECAHCLVSLTKILDTRSQALHRSRYLVPENGREGKSRLSVHHVEVRVADAAGAHLNQNLALLRLWSFQLLDGERLPGAPE